MNGHLRVATVGTGFFSQFHYNAWQRLADAGEAEIVGICGLDRPAAETLAGRFGMPPVFDDFVTMLDAVDAELVDIITPPETHAAFVRAAVERGLAAICQKPFTPDLETARALVADIERNNGRVFVHENFRFQPWYPKLKSLLDAGAIGTPYQLTFRLRPGDGQGPDAYLDRQPYFQAMPRFLIHETAIHLIDTFRFLFGEVRSVYARLERLNPVIAGEDAGVVLFDFDDGRRGIFDGNRLLDHAAKNRRLTMGEMQLEGSAGALALDGDGRIRRRRFGRDDWKEIDFEWRDIDFGGDCVYLTIRHIVDHLQYGSPVMNTAADYLANLEIEDAIYRSAESGRRVDC